MPKPLLYGELADWWPLLSGPEEYEEEAGIYVRLLNEASPGGVESVLELGSGGGNNASYMKHHFDLTLVDISPEMLAVSERLNPELRHVQGDMRTLRLGETFDAVFIHDAIAYITTAEDLQSTFRTAHAHLRDGGIALFCPDHVTETFAPATEHGGNDGAERSLRYLMWTHEAVGSQYLVDFAYLLKDEDGSVRCVQDRHEEGLFARADWLRWLEEAGFDARAEMVSFSDYPDMPIFIATRR
jgi:SAM-dependent methyltransferase